jgi:hypothetical protein
MGDCEPAVLYAAMKRSEGDFVRPGAPTNGRKGRQIRHWLQFGYSAVMQEGRREIDTTGPISSELRQTLSLRFEPV